MTPRKEIEKEFLMKYEIAKFDSVRYGILVGTSL